MNRQEFLDNVFQMMNDNHINCEHCAWGDKTDDYIICNNLGIGQAFTDYCSRFEDKVEEDV